MAIVATTLGSLLTTKADYNYYIQQQIHWQNLYEANSAKLEEQIRYETKWESAYDSAIDNTKELKAPGIIVAANNTNEALADAYAHAKVKHYNEELSLELADLDIEYDTMKTMYDTLVAQLQEEVNAEKSLVQNCAQDTGLLQS